AAVAERGRVRLTDDTEASISLVPTLFAAVLVGPPAAMVVAAASFAGEFRRPYLRWATYTCSRSINGALTGLAAVEASHLASNGLASVAIATTVGASLSQTLDVSFATLT